MIADIVKHTPFHFASIHLHEISVRNRHSVFLEKILGDRRFFPIHHGVFILRILFLIIMDDTQGSKMLQKQTPCGLRTVYQPSSLRIVRVFIHAPSTPRKFPVHRKIRRFAHNLLISGSPFRHFSIPYVRFDDNEIVVERYPPGIGRSRIQQILVRRHTDLYKTAFGSHLANMLQNGPLCSFILLQSMKRAVPFAPRTNHTGLYHLNHIFILSQERLKLLCMTNNVIQGRTSLRPPHELGFIRKAKHCLLPQAAQLIEKHGHRPEIFLRQVFPHCSGQVKIGLHQGYAVRSIHLGLFV